MRVSGSQPAFGLSCLRYSPMHESLRTQQLLELGRRVTANVLQRLKRSPSNLNPRP